MYRNFWARLLPLIAFVILVGSRSVSPAPVRAEPEPEGVVLTESG